MNALSCMHSVSHTTVADFQPCRHSPDRHIPPSVISSNASNASNALGSVMGLPCHRAPHVRIKTDDNQFGSTELNH
jgi:hypothetical protein